MKYEQMRVQLEEKPEPSSVRRYLLQVPVGSHRFRFEVKIYYNCKIQFLGL